MMTNNYMECLSAPVLCTLLLSGRIHHQWVLVATIQMINNNYMQSLSAPALLTLLIVGHIHHQWVLLAQ